MTRRTKQPTTPEELFEANKGLPYHIAKRYKVPEEDRDDMIQEGMLALWRACLGYKPNDNNTFGTYAGKAIMHAYNRFTSLAWNNSGLSASDWTIRAAYKASEGEGKMKEGYARLLQDVLSIQCTVYKNDADDDDAVTIADQLAVSDDYTYLTNEAIDDVLYESLMYLNRSERGILTDYYGLYGNNAVPTRELADRFGVSNYTIYQWRDQALERLAEVMPSHTRDLLE